MRVRGVCAGVAGLLLAAACSGGEEPAPRTSSVAPSTTASAATRAPVSTDAAAGSFTVVMSGDVLLHPPLVDQAEADDPGPGMDFGPMLAAQRPIIGPADLAICHLETPLAGEGGPYSGYPAFNSPPDIVDDLKTVGYDVCTTASNHTIDRGTSGVKRTLDALDRAGIRHTGSARSARESQTPLILTVKGVRVALLSYAYGTNGIPLPSGRPWTVNIIDTKRILSDAKGVRADGADVVLVALHAGTEYRNAPNDQQVQLARALTASPDIDLVYGHHAHVVQPFEKVNGKWVVYGLGNTLAKTSSELQNGSTREQTMARFTFARTANGGYAVERAEYIPGYLPFTKPYRWVDLTSALATSSLPAGTRAAYAKAAADIRRVVGSRGAFAAGLQLGTDR